MKAIIKSFVYWNSPFNTYADKLGERFVTFKLALNLFLQHEGKTIVETGSLRSLGHGWRGDGNATIIFGEFVTHYGGHLWTCDIQPEVIETSKQGTAAFRHNITYVCQDSCTFLATFSAPIDLLYLDSLDCPREGDASEAQRHNLEELMLALPKMTPTGVILMDDNWYSNGGKTALSKEYLLENNWLCLFDSRQTVWIRHQ